MRSGHAVAGYTCPPEQPGQGQLMAGDTGILEPGAVSRHTVCLLSTAHPLLPCHPFSHQRPLRGGRAPACGPTASVSGPGPKPSRGMQGTGDHEPGCPGVLWSLRVCQMEDLGGYCGHRCFSGLAPVCVWLRCPSVGPWHTPGLTGTRPPWGMCGGGWAWLDSCLLSLHPPGLLWPPEQGSAHCGQQADAREPRTVSMFTAVVRIALMVSITPK